MAGTVSFRRLAATFVSADGTTSSDDGSWIDFKGGALALANGYSTPSAPPSGASPPRAAQPLTIARVPALGRPLPSVLRQHVDAALAGSTPVQFDMILQAVDLQGRGVGPKLIYRGAYVSEWTLDALDAKQMHVPLTESWTFLSADLEIA